MMRINTVQRPVSTQRTNLISTARSKLEYILTTTMRIIFRRLTMLSATKFLSDMLRMVFHTSNRSNKRK